MMIIERMINKVNIVIELWYGKKKKKVITMLYKYKCVRRKGDKEEEHRHFMSILVLRIIHLILWTLY